MAEHDGTGRLRLRTVVVAGVLSLGMLGAGVTGQAQAGPDIAAGTPCTAAARACVDLAGATAWLIEGGDVVRGPVPISSGAPGHETPRGDFAVEWKHDDHVSSEFDNAPMPWAVFFAPGGIAFHEGRTDTPSAGCIRLPVVEAKAFFDALQIGDRVEVR